MMRQIDGLLRNLLLTQRFAVLTTQDLNGPYASLVAFNATPDLQHIAFATGRTTRKYQNLKRQSEVAILVDNRPADSDGIPDSMAVTAMGLAREATAIELDPVRKAYVSRHPYLADFVYDTECALFVVSVSVYNGVKALGDTFEWRP